MLVDLIRDAYTAGEIKRVLRSLGLKFPFRITDMYLNGEPPEYMAAAVVVLNQQCE